MDCTQPWRNQTMRHASVEGLDTVARFRVVPRCAVYRIERSVLKGRETGLVKPTPEAARMHARRSAQNADQVTLVNESKVGRESREVRLTSRKAIEGG